MTQAMSRTGLRSPPRRLFLGDDEARGYFMVSLMTAVIGFGGLRVPGCGVFGLRV